MPDPYPPSVYELARALADLPPRWRLKVIQLEWEYRRRAKE